MVTQAGEIIIGLAGIAAACLVLLKVIGLAREQFKYKTQRDEYKARYNEILDRVLGNDKSEPK